jgi:VIT1/CCC1 family predicted Fe2+/Mn2+ transporter
MKRFVPRYLDPASRLGEVLFGLIMVLTVTLTAGFAVDEGRAGVRELLLAAIGCNVAWGVIDAAMYLMDAITVRTGKMRLVTAVQGASSSAAALALIRDEIEPELQELLDPSEREAFSTSVFRHISRAQATTKILTRDDVYGALACFVLVFLSSLPAVLPFLFFAEPHSALRVSNFLLVVILFVVGQKWADYLGINRLACGSVVVLIGLGLVGIAVLLGG